MQNRIQRHICSWQDENAETKNVGELIINKNEIEFYLREGDSVFRKEYYATDEFHNYKVVTYGAAQVGKNQTIDSALSMAVDYVLMQNYSFPSDSKSARVTSFSFVIPELINWLKGVRTVQMEIDDNSQFYAREIEIPIIEMHKDPYIYIGFESDSYNQTLNVDDRTEIIVKKLPRIYIQYSSPATIEQLRTDLRALMQFWGLMIGEISSADDIRLKTETEDLPSWLYVNEDLSYNTRTWNVLERPRTTIKENGEGLIDYFTNWYEFYNNELYGLIRRMYFFANRRRDVFAEDVFTLYVRILEGYHLRKTGSEEQAQRLNEAIKKIEKDIKPLIFSDEGKPLFSRALDEAIPDWHYTSAHADSISKWIAQGYIGRVGLFERLKQLDKEFYNIISHNAPDVLRENQTENNLTEKYLKKIVATRNFYSHFKADESDLLSFGQLCDTINVLKALILMILYENMGMDAPTIRHIMAHDPELHFQTLYLHNEATESAPETTLPTD